MPRLPLRPLLFLVSFFAFVVLLDAFNRSQSFKLSSLRSTSEGSLRWLPSYGSKAAPSFIPPKPKAAFVILARNFDLPELLPPLASLEQSFNAHPLNNYPYIFLNNHPWQDEFKDKLTSYLNAHRRRVGGPSPAPLEIYFQQIAVEDWEPKNGTITIRSVVSALGRFQLEPVDICGSTVLTGRPPRRPRRRGRRRARSVRRRRAPRPTTRRRCPVRPVGWRSCPAW